LFTYAVWLLVFRVVVLFWKKNNNNNNNEYTPFLAENVPWEKGRNVDVTNIIVLAFHNRPTD
jgi:hypothetical protein